MKKKTISKRSCVLLTPKHPHPVPILGKMYIILLLLTFIAPCNLLYQHWFIEHSIWSIFARVNNIGVAFYQKILHIPMNRYHEWSLAAESVKSIVILGSRDLFLYTGLLLLLVKFYSKVLDNITTICCSIPMMINFHTVSNFQPSSLLLSNLSRLVENLSLQRV